MLHRFAQALEDKRVILFLVAGSLLALFGLLHGVEALTGTTAAADVFGPPGYGVAALGLLGLYPPLADRSRWLARSGVFAAALALVGWAILTVLSVLEVAGVAGAAPEASALGGVVLGLTGIGMVLGYPLFAIAALRSEGALRPVGLLLLIPAAIFVSVFAVLAPVVGDVGGWGPFIAGSAQALAHLAIGFALRREDEVAVLPRTRDLAA